MSSSNHTVTWLNIYHHGYDMDMKTVQHVTWLLHGYDLVMKFKWPGGIVASTFASHADDRGLIPSGDQFGRMQAAHQTMV